jgi:hypothetical protein
MITILKMYNNKQTHLCAYPLLPTTQYVYQNEHYVTVYILVLHSRTYFKKFSLFMPRRHTRGVEVWLHSFSMLALDRGEWFTSHPSHLTPGKGPRYLFSRRLNGPYSQLRCFGDKKISCTSQDSNANCAT